MYVLRTIGLLTVCIEIVPPYCHTWKSHDFGFFASSSSSSFFFFLGFPAAESLSEKSRNEANSLSFQTDKDSSYLDCESAAVDEVLCESALSLEVPGQLPLELPERRAELVEDLERDQHLVQGLLDFHLE